MSEQDDDLVFSRAYPETPLEQTARWMLDNVRGAYESVYPPGHPAVGEFRVNSGTCLLICCYANALGKVLLHGGPPVERDGKRIRRDFERFREFITTCMPDIETEWKRKSFPLTPKGRLGSTEWLYEVFRCGFVHGFYPGTHGAWVRMPQLREYWSDAQGRVVLNVDHFVRGFEAGVANFLEIGHSDAILHEGCLEFLLSE
jgi:hypothetical protein